LQQSVTAKGWKFYLDEKMNIQNNKLEKLNVLDKLDKGIQAQNVKLDKLDKLDKIGSDIAQMNVGVIGLITYLRERDENPKSSRVNNVGNIQGSTVPVTGTVTRNIEVGQSSSENQNQAYNNERPAGYPDPGLNVYRDEVRVEVPVGKPYFEQPRVEVNKETYTEDAFRIEFNRNAHQRNDGAYRPPRGIENEVRRGRYNFHDNDRNGNYRNYRNFRNDRNERNDRNDRNRFQEPQRNEIEEPNQNVKQEIGINAIGLDNIMNMIEQTYGPNLQRVARPAFRRPYPNRVEREFERPRNYKVPDFSIFSGEDEKTAYEHISRFTIQFGELSNNGNGKLIMFPNSLTGQAFKWYSSLPPHSIETWNDMEEEKFLNHFARTDLGISMADLARLKQELGETTDQFIMRFKRTRLRCQTQLPKSEHIRFVVNGLNFELRKKFEGVNFYDLFDLAGKATRYEGLLREENQRRNTSIGAYY
jgi:hypothetical protein